MITRNTMSGVVCLALFGLLAGPALAGSHLWRINEVFSNGDGSVQFIELKECCGANNENALINKWILSATTGSQFFFPANLGGGTANKHLLLATQSFADLPGAPTPNYIIDPDFLDLNADTLTYWNYPAATFPYSAGALPTDGSNSLVCLANNSSGCTMFETQVNSPTNFAGETGSIDASLPCSADITGDGNVGPADLANLLGSWGPCGKDCSSDLSGDSIVGPMDLAMLLGAWGPCP